VPATKQNPLSTNLTPDVTPTLQTQTLVRNQLSGATHCPQCIGRHVKRTLEKSNVPAPAAEEGSLAAGAGLRRGEEARSSQAVVAAAAAASASAEEAVDTRRAAVAEAEDDAGAGGRGAGPTGGGVAEGRGGRGGEGTAAAGAPGTSGRSGGRRAAAAAAAEARRRSRRSGAAGGTRPWRRRCWLSWGRKRELRGGVVLLPLSLSLTDRPRFLCVCLSV
jgi:hypothetical protein